jgi:hypothetical protein
VCYDGDEEVYKNKKKIIIILFKYAVRVLPFHPRREFVEPLPECQLISFCLLLAAESQAIRFQNMFDPR